MPSPRGELRVLCIGLEAESVTTIKRLLKTSFPDVDTASTLRPQEAPSLTSTQTFDCIIIGDLENADRVDLARKIKEASNVPVILYTGETDTAVEAALKAGVDSAVHRNDHPGNLMLLANQVKLVVESRRLKDEIQRVKHQHRLTLNAVTDEVLIIDPTSHLILDANEAFLRRYGLTLEEARGKTCYQVTHHQETPCSPPDHTCPLRELMETGEAAVAEHIHRGENGVRVVEETFVYPIRDAEENITQVLHVTRDVTQQRQTEEVLRMSEARYRSLVENSPLPVSVTTGEEIVYVNPERLKLTGHAAPEELVGRSGLDNVHPDDREKILNRMKARGYGAEVPRVSRIRMRRLDGSTIHVEDHMSEGVWRGEKAIFHTLVDVTERVRYMERLLALHRHAARLDSADSLEAVLKATYDAMAQALGYTTIDIIKVEDDTLRDVYPVRESYEIPLEGPGVTARAARTGETQLVADTGQDPDYITGPGRLTKGSELAVPVKVEGRVEYVLNVESEKPRVYTDADQTLVEVLAMHMASALRRIRETEKKAQYTEKLEALYHVTEALTSVASMDEVANHVESAVKSIVGFDFGSLLLVEAGALQIRYVWGVELDEEYALPLDGPGVTVRAVRTGEAQLVRDTALDKDFVNPFEDTDFRSELALPVKAGGEVVAVLDVESREVDAFGEEEQRLLSILAGHIASTISNLRQLERERGFAERLESLSRTMASMNTAQTLEELIDQTLTLVEEVIAVPHSAYMQVEGDELVMSRVRGSPFIDLRIPIKDAGITARAARERKSISVWDTRLHPDFVKGPVDSLSELAVPVVAGGEVVGVLNMESPEVRYFDESHMALAEALAYHLASNIERLQREAAMREAQRKAIMERERAEQARRLEEMKTSFIRTATHEIRTPLTSIMGYAELARDLIDAEAQPSLAHYFEVMLRNTDRLDKLTSDLLDVQRIESGRMKVNLEPLQLGEVLSMAAAEVQPILSSRGQTLTVSGSDARVNADRDRLIQVLVNLMVNASKFSPERSEIGINVKEFQGEVWVSVVDRGVGIRKEDMPKLFKPFPGIHVEGVKESTGLGLSICKGIVELHGGRIWAESEGLGKGSTFTFTLPLLRGGGDE